MPFRLAIVVSSNPINFINVHSLQVLETRSWTWAALLNTYGIRKNKMVLSKKVHISNEIQELMIKVL